jgi:Spy/CpxP family protein refolding chaperone
MKKFNYKALILAGFLLTVSFLPVKAQDETLEETPQQNFNQARRPNLLTELDLSQNQIQQIRRINADKKPLMREAQQKVREANRSLDQAIYADEADEAAIQARLKAVQLAQAEVIKIRSTTEFAVRRVLNPSQIVKFREIRQRFMERMENNPNQRKNRPLNPPNQRLFNRQRRQRQNN